MLQIIMKYFETFAGVGGFSQGIHAAIPDAECVGMSEVDKYALSVLRYHYPLTKQYGDISKIDWSTVPDFDLLVGGSPCQDFSVAGKRAGLGGQRSGLFNSFVECLRQKKPQHFIWENVRGVLSSGGGHDFATILNQMAEAGYSLWWQVLNAKGFGVPQNRERIFVVGTRSDRGCPREVFFEAGNDAKSPIEITQNAADAFRVYDPNGINRSLKAESGGTGGKTGLYAVNKNRGVFVEQDDVSNALGANDYKGFDNHGQRTGVTDGIRVRRLMPSECMALMSWSRDWCDWGIDEKGEKFAVSDSQKYKMAGNGVVSNVVAEVVRAHIL